jgi:WXG100 family type VII secretion target
MATDKLSVDTDSLTEYASYLINCKKKLNDQLTDLNNKMDTLTAGWTDDDGKSFSQAFSKFITEARKITDETGKIGEYAKKESKKYNTAVNTALREFGG